MTLDNWNLLSVEDQEKILKAIDRLAKDNPEVAKQLKGLAELKETKPGTWKAGLKFLKLG